MKNDNTYDDIINMEYRKSVKYPHMSLESRGAQFAPFAALTGYSDAVDEEGRITEDMVRIQEDMKDILDNRLRMILNTPLEERPESEVIYFVPDERKSGGSYKTVAGVVLDVDMYGSRIVLSNDYSIPISNIVDIKLNNRIVE